MNHNTLEAKKAIVNEVVEAAKAHNSMVVVEYRGLSVSEMTELRRELRENDARMVIYKNSMVQRAVSELNKPELSEYLTGPNAFVFSKDTIAGPRVISKFARRNEHIVIKGGLLDGRVLDAEGVKAIGKLPGREGLISMFLSVLEAPIRQFAATVKAVAEAKQ
ncbi:MAG: 50S ribosomal protein L10 [Erysipelotrichaceae bacterium]|jgi:large subunit ribosomal protein L10|nr:50S ribosomal protein L10 [Bacillota bacterium]MDY0117962.1 50S ribosomal protein L10 [Bacilli bacterium]NLJ32685.1 50S ribosomal protein L10 [Erysipelotrichaceae bacterium]